MESYFYNKRFKFLENCYLLFEKFYQNTLQELNMKLFTITKFFALVVLQFRVILYSATLPQAAVITKKTTQRAL